MHEMPLLWAEYFFLHRRRAPLRATAKTNYVRSGKREPIKPLPSYDEGSCQQYGQLPNKGIAVGCPPRYAPFFLRGSVTKDVDCAINQLSPPPLTTPLSVGIAGKASHDGEKAQ